MEEDNIIKLNTITKKYKLYSKPTDRIKEAIGFNRKSYHTEFFALRNISLNVRKGETLGIIGKNGSGKSTLLKIITGVLSPTSGDKVVSGEISALLELGTGFNPEYTGLENIYLNGTMRGYSRHMMNEKLQDIIDFADIGEFIMQPVKTYSSGMFARLAFSVMISFKPEILIVDEALSVGDVFFQQKCNKFMKDKMQGVTKLLVTHDLSSIANMADRVIVISNGEIEFNGDPLKGIEYYTKSIHSEVFKSTNRITSASKVKLSSDIKWKTIENESLGGALEVKISAVNFNVNGEDYKGYISKDDILEVDLMIESAKDVSELIIGYIVNDRYGNAIFGENTLGSKIQLCALSAHKVYRARVNLKWPEIQENDYFITFGIGEGENEMNHTIQCWAHNIIQIKNIVYSPVHALFNNKITDIKINEI